AAGHVEHPRRDAVRSQTVDRPAVAVFPQRAGQPQSRANNQEFVDLVEVPLVEQEFVERLLLASELDRQFRSAIVEFPGDDEADRHQSRWRHAGEVGNMFDILENMVVGREFERAAEKLPDVVTDEQLGERIAGEDRAGREKTEWKQ